MRNTASAPSSAKPRSHEIVPRYFQNAPRRRHPADGVPRLYRRVRHPDQHRHGGVLFLLGPHQGGDHCDGRHRRRPARRRALARGCAQRHGENLRRNHTRRGTAADSTREGRGLLQLSRRRHPPQTCLGELFGTDVCQSQNVADENGPARQRDCVVLGTGIAATPPGNAVALAVHLRGGPDETMKTQREQFVQETRGGPGARKRSEGGMATIIFITLLAIMLILVTAESRALFQLHREVKLLEQQQLERLTAPPTNTVAITTSENKGTICPPQKSQ